MHYCKQVRKKSYKSVVPHHGTNCTALWLTLRIGQYTVPSESYVHGCMRAPTPHIYVDHS